ncbi:MAG: hypothetical protein U0271_01555 [Polyangiaceae bacterium]
MKYALMTGVLGVLAGCAAPEGSALNASVRASSNAWSSPTVCADYCALTDSCGQQDAAAAGSGAPATSVSAAPDPSALARIRECEARCNAASDGFRTGLASCGARDCKDLIFCLEAATGR